MVPRNPILLLLLLPLLPLSLKAGEGEGNAPSESTAPATFTEAAPPTQPSTLPERSYALDQPDTQRHTYTGGFGFVVISTLLPNIQPVNDELAQLGYGTFSNAGYALGGMGLGEFHNFLVGGEGVGLFGDSRDLGRGTHGSWGGWYGNFLLGYAFHPRERLAFYPLLGFGGGSLSFTLVPALSSPSFREIANNPRQGAVLTSSGMLLSLSLGAHYILSADPQGGWVISLRLGYMYSPIPWEFRVFRAEVKDAPNFRGVSGPFLLVGIGGGGTRIRSSTP